jgi:hypothetical protein
VDVLGLWEAHAFRVMAVQDFESVGVKEDGDDVVREVFESLRRYPEKEK